MRPAEQVVHDYSQTPHVYLVIVRSSRPNLWSHVDRCAAVGGQDIVRHDLADAEVRQFQQSLRRSRGQEQVFRLNGEGDTLISLWTTLISWQYRMASTTIFM